MGAANSVASILSNIQIDIGTNLLDAAFNPSAGSGTNFLLLGLGAIGGVALFALLGKLSSKFRSQCNPYSGFSGCIVPRGFNEQHLFGEVVGTDIKGYHSRPGGVDFGNFTIGPILNTKTIPTGEVIYQAKVLSPGLKSKKSTFFPDSWDVQRIQAESESAYIDFLIKGGKGGKFKGTSASGVRIGGYIEPTGEFTTYYPIID